MTTQYNLGTIIIGAVPMIFDGVFWVKRSCTFIRVGVGNCPFPGAGNRLFLVLKNFPTAPAHAFW